MIQFYLPLHQILGYLQSYEKRAFSVSNVPALQNCFYSPKTMHADYFPTLFLIIEQFQLTKSKT